jgi:hypothetical protein
MSTSTCPDRDERTVAVENASYRWAYLSLTFALLLDVAYRSFFRGEAPWDLLALVMGGGLLCTLYQGKHRILGRTWARAALVAFCVGAVLAAVLALALVH